MEELLDQYWECHSKTENDLKIKESLVKQCREFLSTVKPEDRFVHLNIDFYINVLDKICQNEDRSERNEEIMQRIMTGFKSLENYAVNLWKFPWRKEYHSIKLYTAFFKCNIENKLKDTEAIFDLLKSLGYTMMDQQKVYIKESEREHVIWASLSLFLVQVDLQVIKEIMDHFPKGEFTLKDFVKVRSRTSDVGDAVNYLRRKATKRRKTEDLRGDDAPSHGPTKDIHIGRVDAFNNLKSGITSSDAETSVDQNARRPPKLSALSKGRDDVAADRNDSSTRSAVSYKHPSVGVRAGIEMPPGTTGGHYFTSMNSERFTENELYGVSAKGGQSQHNLDARYSTVPQAGTIYDASKYTFDPRHSTFPQARVLQPSADTKETQRYPRTVLKDGHLQYYGSTKDRMDSATAASHSLSHRTTVTTSHSSHQHFNQSHRGFIRDDQKRYSAATQSGTVGAIASSNGYPSKMPPTTETQIHRSSSGDARYVNLRDINSSADWQFGLNKLDEPISTEDSVRGRDDRDVRYGETRGSGAGPMDGEQIENSHDCRGDAFSSCNGVGEGAYATANSRVTELNTTLNQKLTLQSSDGVSGNTYKASLNAHEATGYGDRIPIQGQPSASTNEVRQITRYSATDIKTHPDVKGSLPDPSWRTPSQRERAQNTAHSSGSDLHKETTLEGSIGSKGYNSECELCDVQGTITCGNCHLIICRKCKKLYEVDVCGATKGEHVFVELKDSKVQQSDSKASTSQHYVNVNEGFEDPEKDWPCSRCTFLNPPDNKICAMCATTRGVGPVELTEAGSRVCRECTYHNKENAKVCQACHKTLDLKNPETSV